ncbi:MAG: sodium:alanine symporter family protein [Planctomycetes bacterium]|nr:sodium:alanine symporter family protein [Planctomycetota bacterium]
MDALTRLLEAAAGWLWNWPVVALCLGAGVVFTAVTRLVQARGFAHALGLLAGRHDRPDDPGHLTHLQALSAAVAGTVGLGNIAGVAVAVTVGGPGALFWMWVVGLLGMATKFAEVTLGTHYRVRDERGVYRGGAIYTITRGLPERWPALAPLARPLALVFASACAVATLGAGNMFQARSVAELLRDHHGVPPLLTGVVLAAGAGAVILGGIGRIGRVAATLVPFMCGAYVLVALGICVANAGAVPAALGTILRDAFTGEAAAGGAVWAVIVTGVRRAVFSSEAGLGTAPMAHATARTAEPVRQGLVGLLEPLLDTVVVCSATGLVIVLSGQRPLDGALEGVTLTARAFGEFVPGFGRWALAPAVALFAFSTLVTWSFYGETACAHLLGARAVRPYRVVFIAAVVLGATRDLAPILAFADLTFGVMVIPNLVVVLLLTGKVRALTADYFARRQPAGSTPAAAAPGPSPTASTGRRA